MHAGMLVDNLEKAIDTFGTRLGVQFTAPMVARLDNFTDGEQTFDTQVLCAYSRVGPPYYELIEAHDSGVFGRQLGMGLHHVGLWESDCNAKLAEFEASGLQLEAVQSGPDQQITVAYFKPSSLEGLRIELVNDAFRPVLESLSGG